MDEIGAHQPKLNTSTTMLERRHHAKAPYAVMFIHFPNIKRFMKNQTDIFTSQSVVRNRISSVNICFIQIGHRQMIPGCTSTLVYLEEQSTVKFLLSSKPCRISRQQSSASDRSSNFRRCAAGHIFEGR